MNMLVKLFIEQHIDLIQHDLTSAFKMIYNYDFWSDTTSQEFMKILEECNIPFKEQLQEAIYNIIETELTAFSNSKEPGLYSMPLDEYVDIFINNHIGISEHTWIRYVLHNKEKYTMVNIFEENGMWIVSRKD